MADNKPKSFDPYQLKTPKKELDEARVLELINAYVNSPSFRVLSGSPTLSGLIVTGQIESTYPSGTAPFVVASTTKVTNLNADAVDGFSLDQTVTTAGSPSFVQVTSTVATGTAPFVVASTTKVTNLNADTVDGFSMDQAVLTTSNVQFNNIEIDGALNHDGTTVGLFGVTPVTRAAAYTQTYSTADRTLGAYTSDPESSAYTGIDNAQPGSVYATVADLNQLRVAYETLRAHAEDNAQMTNALVDDLQAYGLLQ